MATDLENLLTARANLYAALAEHGHKRNYSVDGQSVDTDSLWRRLKMLDDAIAAAGGPFEVIDRGIT